MWWGLPCQSGFAIDCLETLEEIDHVEREDGWVVLFRGPEAILRVQESHVKSMEQVD